MGSISPSVLRSSGISAMPMRLDFAARGLEMGTVLPSISSSPLTPFSTPNSASSSSRWPWPSRPPRPTTSPARAESEISRRRLVQERLRISRIGGLSLAASAGLGGKTWLYSRPIIISTTSSSVLVPARYVATLRPLRNTVHSSAISAISCMRCEM